MKIINKTFSICGKCHKNIPAEIIEKEKRIFIRKKCEKHGETICDHVWDDPEIYWGMLRIKTASGGAMQLIVDVTKKCNLNCTFCFARANESIGSRFKKEDLNLLKSYKQIFISGGEPTVREDLPDIIRQCVKNKQKPILFTNGIKLADEEYVKNLSAAGLRSVLLQLDTLDESKCEYIRGKKLVNIKIKALENLKKYDIPVAIWTVVVKDKNFHEITDLHRFVLKYPNVKSISAIPIWRVGRFKSSDFVPPSAIIKKLCEMYGVEKTDFILTARLLCNIDRFLSIFNKKRGKLFSKCMSKVLLFNYGGSYISITKVFDLKEINKRIDSLFKNKERIYRPLLVIRFLWYLLISQFLINFVKNSYFRSILFKLVRNLKYIVSKKYLIVNPFHFITVGIFPNENNIDLDFIEPCNSYALNTTDFSFKPACLYYIEQAKIIHANSKKNN